MKIQEADAKTLLVAAGLPVPPWAVARTAAEARAAAERFLADGAGRVVIKAQVLVGGRGKAGGVKLAASPAGGGGHRLAHPRHGHQGDHRPQGPRRAGRRDRQGVLPRGHPGPGQPADRRDGVRRGRRRDRGGRQDDARGDPPRRGPSAPRAARLPGARAGVRRRAGRAAPARLREDRPGPRDDDEGQRCRPRRGEPAGDHPRERLGGPRRAPRLPRREGHPRRLGAAAPPRPGEAPRPRRGGPGRLRGAPLRHQLHPPRRVDRLHGQRRRAWP